MTDLRQAAQQALEALETLMLERWSIYDTAITALREALAQPAQEPVAWAVQGCSKMWRGEFAEIDAKAEAKRIGGTCVAYALYTTPPAAQRPWVGLTDEDLDYLCHLAYTGDEEFALAVQARLQERNT